MRTGSLRYVPALDGLRAVAVGAVVVHHAWPGAAFAGHTGVDVFFVLSGYLITSILLREHARTGRIGLRRFWLRRLWRLYPALIAVVLLTLPFFPLLGLGPAHVVAYGGPVLTYTTNLVNGLLGRGVGPFGHTWSLAQEEQFYLVWPVVLALLLHRRWPPRRIAALLAVPAVLSLALSLAEESQRNSLARSGGLLLGAAVAVLLAGRDVRLPAALGRAGLAGLVGTVAVCSLVPALERAAVLGVTLSSVALVAYLATAPGSAGVLSWRPLVWVGLVSYSLYLWHYPLFFVLREGLGWGDGLIGAVGVPLAVALAAASYHLVERPTLALRDRRETGVTPQPGAAGDGVPRLVP